MLCGSQKGHRTLLRLGFFALGLLRIGPVAAPLFVERVRKALPLGVGARSREGQGGNRRVAGLDDLDAVALRNLKRKGFSDRRLATLTKQPELAVREQRVKLGVRPVYKRVDTCAAEFATSTAYLYSSYEEECEAAPTDARKIMILGGGPNRIGQGIEFDYCCVHAALALREDGFETIMVNCNPETVSTDYDTSDRLYFEPLTLEDVLEIIAVEKKGSIRREFPGEHLGKTLKEIEELARQGNRSAKKAKKLLRDRRFNKCP